MKENNTTYIETLELTPKDLTPYPGNPKLHDTDAIGQSINTNGQYRAVLARRLPNGTLQLLAGHGTTDAINRTPNQKIRVEIVEADDTTARRIVLADNAIGNRSGYDDTALLALLDQANTNGGLTGTGYDQDTYQALLDQAETENPHNWQPETDPDDQDTKPPVEPACTLGDVWELGNHRLVCGDSTDPQTLTTLLAAEATKYCDVIARRWQEITGKTPLLNGKPVNLMRGKDDA